MAPPTQVFEDVPVVEPPPAKISFKDLNIERSPMATAFRHIPGGWREYMKYARMSANDGDEDMVAFVKSFDALSKKEQKTIMPEQVCDMAGVQTHKVMGQVTAFLWISNQNEGMQIAAIAHPRVVESTTYLASLKTPDTFRERDLHFRTLGLDPSKKGTTLNVNVNNNTVNATAQYGQRSNLPRFEESMKEMELITDGDEDGSNVIDISSIGEKEEQYADG